MITPGKILIIDDEKIALKNLEHIMKKEGYQVTATQSGTTALTLLDKERFDAVLSDVRMEKVDGMQILNKCRATSPNTEVIMITGYATLESAIDAMKHGAFHYIAKPFRLDEVRQVVKEAVSKSCLKRENAQLKEQIDNLQGKVRIVTQDSGIIRLMEVAKQIAPADCNLLITGESGTGKELLAKYVHIHSNRTDGPFMAINCGAFNEDLLSNELFGHEKGAYTGATSVKKGLIEAASGGTLLLDEITEMSPAMQVKLLRVIQEQEVLRLGATKPVKVDVRFIAATNRDIQESLQNGKIRQDLYFRLNVVHLHIPPLSERKQDIPLLSHFFLKKFSTLMKKPVDGISPEVLDRLTQYEFPGNVRELENIIERGVAMTHTETIEVDHLPDNLKHWDIPIFRKKEGQIPTLDDHEKDYIQWVLQECQGNQTLAAQTLGIDRVSLWRKLKRYQLNFVLPDGTTE